ncbi:MAG TPA: hypothetical protein VK968_09345 [Roseimicrobium sp.]|nr:hypothetical protein [Roseimicrobium sp.]
MKTLHLIALICLLPVAFLHAAGLRAGVARMDITERAGVTVNDPLYAKALVLKSDSATVVLITIDAVAIGEIGRIGNRFLPNIRAQLQKDLGIAPSSVLINASHCHGVVVTNTEQLTVQAVKEAWKNLVPVKVGAGAAQESRISENRRLRMKDGGEIDMRRAYSLPRDEDVAGVGPIDPEVGLLRIDREDGRPLAVLYNFACHPIMNPPNKGNSADYPGFASRLIEEGLGNGAMAFFVQGCGGDINPVRYKDVGNPPDAEPLGNLLGMTVLTAVKKIPTRPDAALKIVNETVRIPRGADYDSRIAAIEKEQARLLRSLKPTDINFRSFLPLYLQQKLSPSHPSFYSQGYLHDKSVGRDDLAKLDESNRKNVEAYLENIQSMERLTRLNVNLALLKRHLAEAKAAGSSGLDVEILGVRVGDFQLVTFPGELTVEIGLEIKKRAGRPHSFVAGYSNGYIYYTPTEKQRGNTGYAQEDCDCIVAPEWQRIFESKALEVLKGL